MIVGRDYVWKDDFTAAREWTQRAVALTAGRDPVGKVAARLRVLAVALMNDNPEDEAAALAAGLAQVEELGTPTQRHPFRFTSALRSGPSKSRRVQSVLDWVRSDVPDEQYLTLGNGGDRLLALGLVDKSITWMPEPSKPASH